MIIFLKLWINSPASSSGVEVLDIVLFYADFVTVIIVVPLSYIFSMTKRRKLAAKYAFFCFKYNENRQNQIVKSRRLIKTTPMNINNIAPITI